MCECVVDSRKFSLVHILFSSHPVSFVSGSGLGSSDTELEQVRSVNIYNRSKNLYYEKRDKGGRSSRNVHPTNRLLMFCLISLFILVSYLFVSVGDIYYLSLVIQISCILETFLCFSIAFISIHELSHIAPN